jgi:hypothetical protein
MDPLNKVKTNENDEAVSSSMNTLSLTDETSSNTTQPIIPNDRNEEDNPPLDCMLWVF